MKLNLAIIKSAIRQRYIALRYLLHRDHDPRWWCGSRYCAVARDVARKAAGR